MAQTTEETSRVLDPVDLERFIEQMTGDVILPNDERYDQARRVWNGLVVGSPVLIAQCTGTEDVVKAVNFAREQELPLAIRGGGHSMAGHSTSDGIVIDLSPMKRIEIDPDRQVATAQAGLLWKEYTGAAQEHGLATPSGPVSMVGVGGLTVGGGFGWISRKYGLTIDSLLSAEIVTPDGQVRRASAGENPDLFWAIRGGGGNFGVITEFQFRLHEVPTVLAGLILYPAEQSAEILRFYRDFAATAPDELTTLIIRLTAPPAPFLPASLHGAPILAIGACYVGPLDDGENVLAPLRSFGQPYADMIQPMPYTVLGSMFNDAAAPGMFHSHRSDFVRELDDDLIDTLIGHTETMPNQMAQVQIQHLGGAISRVSADETAYSHRDKPFSIAIIGTWIDPAESALVGQWTDELWQALRPHAAGVYVNFLDDEGEDRVREAYSPATYERLRQIKREYDPTNLFRLNQNIRP